MEENVIMEWTFTPDNYFEGDIKENLGTFNLEIANGKIRATLSHARYDGSNKVLEDIHNEVRAFFEGVQVVSHKPFKLSKYTLFHEHADGRKDITVFPDPCVMEVGMGTVDVVITDSAGNTITDTRADRIRQKIEFAKLSAKHSSTDSTARGMLSSYEASVNDPGNELVHLYEIRDAVKKKFGNERTAQSTLRISQTDWKRLGSLSNNAPLKQGRHRGQSLDTLRAATNEDWRRHARSLSS
jgi:hypothetical protein